MSNLEDPKGPILYNVYEQNKEAVERMYKSAMAIWIWPYEETPIRIVPKVTEMYHVSEIYYDEDDKPAFTMDSLVIPYDFEDIFVGFPIAVIKNTTLKIVRGHPIATSRMNYFCNECDKDPIEPGGWLCEACDYDICLECANNRHLHIHPMFEFVMYYGLSVYKKDNIVQTFSVSLPSSRYTIKP
jgi:hypothetical protein